MRLKSILLSGAVVAAFLTMPVIAPNIMNLASTAQAQSVSLSFSVFYDGLRDDGDWTDYNGGYVFVPSNIDANWRPYTRGHWVHTAEFGWVWESTERFGWATYHYGRWGYAREIGWYWVPGRRWAPAWVSWRRTDTDVMWAPLPPTGYNDDGSFASYTDASLSALPFYFWVSIPTHNFQDRNLSSRIIFDANQNQRIFQRSHFDGPVVIKNNVVINNVINTNFIQQQTGKPVQNVAVTTTTNPAGAKAPQPGQQSGVTAFQGQLKVDPAVKPVDVKPVAQVEQKVVNHPKLPTDMTPPNPAASPADGSTKPAAGVQTQGNVPAPTPKPGETVTPPKDGAVVVPLKPGEPVTPPKDGEKVLPLKPGEAVTPPKGGAAVVPLKPPDIVPPAKLDKAPAAPKVDRLPIPKESGIAIPPAVPMNKQLQVTPRFQPKPIPANPPAMQVRPKYIAPMPQMGRQPVQPRGDRPVAIPRGAPHPPAVINKQPPPPDKAPACTQGAKDCPPANG